MDDRAPRPVGTPLKELTITGMIFPWRENSPLFIKIESSDDLYLPIFSTPEKLDTFFQKLEGLPRYERIKQIDDGPEFIASLPLFSDVGELVHVILDPRTDPDGMLRWTQVFRGMEGESL